MDDKENLDPGLQKELDDANERLLDALGDTFPDVTQRLLDAIGDTFSGSEDLLKNIVSAELTKALEPVRQMMIDFQEVYHALKPHFEALMTEDPDNAYLSVGVCTLKAVMHAESAGEVLPEVVVEYLKKHMTSVDGSPWDGTQSVTDFVEQQQARKTGSETKTRSLSELGQLMQNKLLTVLHDTKIVDLGGAAKNQGVQRVRDNEMLTRDSYMAFQPLFEEATNTFSNGSPTIGIMGLKIIWAALAVITARSTKEAYTADDLTVVLDTPEFLGYCGRDIVTKIDDDDKHPLYVWQAAKRDLQEAMTEINKLVFRRTRGKKRAPEGMDEIRPLQMVSYDKKRIIVTFDIGYATWLKNTREAFTQFDPRYLLLSGKNRKAFTIGLRLSEHYYMDANRMKGTHGKLQVGGLLDAADFVFDGVHDWRQIKERFEYQLDVLYDLGVLKMYTYDGKAGCPMTDEEKEHIVDGTFDNYRNRYLIFELDDEYLPQDWQKRAVLNAKQKIEAIRKKIERERERAEKWKEKTASAEKNSPPQRTRKQILAAERAKRYREKKKAEAAK